MALTVDLEGSKWGVAFKSPAVIFTLGALGGTLRAAHDPAQQDSQLQRDRREGVGRGRG